jgi:type I restriction enzyme S subunit
MKAEVMPVTESSERYRSAVEAVHMPSGYKQTEVGVIPEDWQVFPVGRMGEVLTGKALAVNAPGTQRPYLRTKNVFDGRIDIDDVLTMPMTDAQFEQFKVLPGDALLNEGQSLELVGRCAMYRGEYPQPCAMQNQLLRFRARSGVSAEFASHLFRYCQQTGVFTRIALQTTSIAHLGGTRFERLLLPWPASEGEQRAIAEVLSDADALIGALDKLIAKKRAIRLATMQQLLAGKIRLPGHRPFTTIEKDTQFGKVHDDWDVACLSQFADIRRGASPRPINSPIWYDRNSTTGWVRISDVANSDGIHLRSTRDYLSARGVQASRFLEPQTLIMSICATVGLPIITAMPACIHDGFVAFLKLGGIDLQFLYYVLKYLEPQFRALGQTGSQNNLNSELVRNKVIAYPSITEQRAIAQVLADMDAEIAELTRRLEKTKAVKHGMMQALLTGRVRLVKREAVA